MKRLLRILTLLLVIFAVIIMSLTFGFSSRLSEGQSKIVYVFYLLYENVFRAVTVILGSFLTVRFLNQRKKGVGKLQKNSLLALSVSSVFFLVLVPLVTGFWEGYLVLMPAPWSSVPLQMIAEGVAAEENYHPVFGLPGSTYLLFSYCAFQLIFLGGSLLLGRRWQCSMICQMNGGHAESLGEALPFFAHNPKKPASKRVHPVAAAILRRLQWPMFIVSTVLFLLWVLYLITGLAPFSLEALKNIEMIKHLSLELTLFMILWLLIGGRGYCYYCPAGLTASLIGRAVGQKIKTDNAPCIGCGICNDRCKMSIDIMSFAREGRPLVSNQCVGCGICVDNCPVGALSYETRFWKSGTSTAKVASRK